MKKIAVAIFLLLFPLTLLAQDGGNPDKGFKAVVLEVLEEKENVLPDGSSAKQQDLKLKGLSGEMSEKEFYFRGIADFDVLNKNIYKAGDMVVVIGSADHEGNISYYITDFVRTGPLFVLFFLFAFFLLIVGRGKGLRSLLSLALTFFVIVKFIVPHALTGGPIIVPTLLGGIVILGMVIYLTEGFNKKSNLAVFSIVISLSLTVFLSWIFVALSHLSGLGSEEISNLINIGSGVINFKGLLLSGIIIGALGVIDDVVISQIVSVEQLYAADPKQSAAAVFKKAMEIGVSHIGSMTNTLFLAYAGASLPLLVLFVSGESAFSGWGEVINNEAIATEIVRTLSGSIGLILAVPIATFLAARSLRNKS